MCWLVVIAGYAPLPIPRVLLAWREARATTPNRLPAEQAPWHLPGPSRSGAPGATTCGSGAAAGTHSALAPPAHHNGDTTEVRAPRYECPACFMCGDGGGRVEAKAAGMRSGLDPPTHSPTCSVPSQVGARCGTSQLARPTLYRAHLLPIHIPTHTAHVPAACPPVSVPSG